MRAFQKAALSGFVLFISIASISALALTTMRGALWGRELSPLQRHRTLP
jgi:hypothetical protein